MYVLKVLQVCILPLLFVTTKAWDEKEAIRDIQDEIKMLRDEFGVLNGKIDAIMVKDGITVDSVDKEISIPEWPPLKFLNISRSDESNGVRYSIWYATLGSCEDISVFWSFFYPMGPIQEEARTCEGSVTKIGSSSVIVDKHDEELEVDVSTRTGSYGIKLTVRDLNITEDITSPTDLFFFDTHDVTTYHKGEPIILNAVYKSEDPSSTKVSLQMKLETLHPRKDTVIDTVTCFINPYNDISNDGTCTMRKLQHRDDYELFEIHIDTDIVAPYGFITVYTDLKSNVAAPYTLKYYQRIATRRDTDTDLYPQNVLDLSVISGDQCELNRRCYIVCEARGMVSDELVLYENRAGSQKKDILKRKNLKPASVEKRPYHIRGWWQISQADIAGERVLLCGMNTSDGVLREAYGNIYVMQSPQIVMEESYLHIDWESKNVTLKCTATGKPKLNMKTKILHKLSGPGMTISTYDHKNSGKLVDELKSKLWGPPYGEIFGMCEAESGENHNYQKISEMISAKILKN